MKKMDMACWAAIVASCGSGGALAQETQIYGTFNVDVESVRATGATPAETLPRGQLGATPTGIDVSRRNRVTSNSSNFGIRGSDVISPALTAFFQVESAVGVDAGNTNIASRNTAAGLKSAWGTLFLGQWDTPYKTLSGGVDPMYFTGITYTGALIGTPGFNVGPVTNGAPVTSADGKSFAGAANASFERRQGNSVQYWSPTWSGFSMRLAYSANETKTSSSPAVTQVNPYILSGSVEYQAGILYLGYAHEDHRDYFGLDAIVPGAQATQVAATASFPSSSGRDQGDKYVARVKFARTQLGVMAERLRYEKSQALPSAATFWFSSYRREAYVVTLVQGIGAAGTIRGFVGRANAGKCTRFDGADCSTSGLGARQISLGYSHTLSRRTDLYAFFTRVSNDAHGSYPFANGAGLGAAPGADNVGYALGIRHTF